MARRKKDETEPNPLFVEQSLSVARRRTTAAVKKDPEALVSIPPIVLGVDLMDGFDHDQDETLMERCVLLSPIVNPLFDAVMLTNGGRKLGQRSYAFSLSVEEGGDVQSIFNVLDAIPYPALITADAMKSAAKRGMGSSYSNDEYWLEREISQSSLFAGCPSNANDPKSLRYHFQKGRERYLQENTAHVYDINHFEAKREGLRHLEHTQVSLAANEGQLFVKVATGWVRHRGFRTIEHIDHSSRYEYNSQTKRQEKKIIEKKRVETIPHKGFYFWDGAANLNRMKTGKIDQPIKVTPAEAVSMLEAAQAWGFEIEDKGKVKKLSKRFKDLALVEREPASPGRARLVVGRKVAPQLTKSLQERLSPLNQIEKSAVQALAMNAEEAGKAIRSIRRATKGVEIVVDPRVDDILRMQAATPIKHAPGSCAEAPRPDQEEAIALHRATRIGFLNASDVGFGKSLRNSAQVLTPYGWKRNGDLEVGDMVIGSDGKATKVTGVFPRGELAVFNVAFSDGSSIECDGDHLWTVQPIQGTHDNPRPRQTHETRWLAEKLTWANGNSRWKLPMVKPVEFADGEKLKMDPYVLGVLLGDGSISSPDVNFCSADPEIAALVRERLPKSLYMNDFSRHSKARLYRICAHQRSDHPLRAALHEYELMGKRSYEKSIPRPYLYASPDDRLAVLQGLMDTDGTVAKNSNHLEFSSSSLQLVEDVQFIVQSLGGTAAIAEKKGSFYTNPAGERVNGRRHWRLSVRMPQGMNPFLLPRKRDAYNPDKYRPARVIKSITPAGREQCTCIQVEAEDHLYVTEHFLVTHNTVTTAQAERDDAREVDAWRSLIVVQAALSTQWHDEIGKWFPEAQLAQLDNSQMKGLDAFLAEAGDAPAVVLISRETMRAHADKLAEHFWHELVIDEAAFLAGTSSKQTQAAWTLRPAAERAVALTGTPIERSLDSIGRILSWCRNEPTIFHGNRLEKRFDMSKPEDVGLMWDALGPTVFRRDQSEFDQYLPPIETSVLKLDPDKTEMNLADGASVELRRLLVTMQTKAALAEKLPEKDPRRIAVNQELKKVRGAVLGGVTLTRQAASDPAALLGSKSSGVELLEAADLIAPAIKHGGTKRKAVCDLVDQYVAAGDAILIFTDFSTVAYKLREELQRRGVRAQTFTGDDTKKQRDERKAAFMAGELDVLILTSTGREGHNLQRANVIIHYDLPWLPSQVVQRVGRARRHGSTASHLRVLIPIMVGTIEERVAALLVPRAIKALVALDTHRGVDGSKTSTGTAVGKLADVVPDQVKEAENKGLFALAAEVLGV